MTREQRARARAAAVATGLALAAVLVLGCADAERDLAPEGGDVPAATEPDLELQPPVGERAESDLPGHIPPAVGEADAPGGAAAGGGTPGSAEGVTGDGAAAAAGAEDDAARPGVTAFTGATGRGQYLAEQVAMCVQCHSPKDESGRVIAERKFLGSPIPIDSPFRGQDWALEAPPLAGMASYTREEAVRLLTEGIARDGMPPRPPMPPFRMSAQDAGAVYDFLASLPRTP